MKQLGLDDLLSEVTALAGQEHTIAPGRPLTMIEAAWFAQLCELERHLRNVVDPHPVDARQPGRRRRSLAPAVELLAEHLPDIVAGLDVSDRAVAVRSVAGFALRLPPQVWSAAVARCNADDCLGHLLSALVAAPRSRDQRQVSQWIEAAGVPGRAHCQAANAVLGRYGLGVGFEPSPAGPKGWFYVANTYPALVELFAGTAWARPKRGRMRWVLALRQIEGARSVGARRFHGIGARATAIPLSVLPMPAAAIEELVA